MASQNEIAGLVFETPDLKDFFAFSRQENFKP